jgi:hypothetical protein
MDNAIYDFLLPKLVGVGLDFTLLGNQHLLLLLMRSIKKAKEMLSNLPKVCQCAECTSTNCLQAAVSIAGLGAGGVPVYWSYQLTREEMELVTKPVVGNIVNALRDALLEVCLLQKWVKLTLRSSEMLLLNKEKR